MADVDGIAQVEMLHDGSGVGSVVVHVVTIADLARATMPAPVVRNDAIPLLEEVQHLGVPVVGAQWPAMMEDDRLRALRTPGLVVDRRTVLDCDRVHLRSSLTHVFEPRRWCTRPADRSIDDSVRYAGKASAA